MKKCRRRLDFAVVTDIELVVVAIYTRRRHPCCRFSDPSSPVSVFTVDKAEELGGGGGNKIVVFLEDVRALVEPKPVSAGNSMDNSEYGYWDRPAEFTLEDER
ncbi:hypothetical protein YC2023_114959 [Brassica napus]